MGAGISLDPARLCELLEALFAAHGCAQAEAHAVARHLVEADLSGHPSHGAGLTPLYLANIRSGEVRVNRVLERVPIAGGFLLFEGGRGFGQSLGGQLVDQVVALCGEHGVAVFGLRNSHHMGRIGDYGERFAVAGFASALFVNTVSRPIVAPHGGSEARMGTNPVCIAMPRRDAPPLVLDFATSAIAVGKCRVALENGQSIPPGAAIDADGEPTTDPAVLYSSPQGALRAMGAHKGSGMNLLCELFAACIGGLTMCDANPASGGVINNLVGMCFRASALPGAQVQIESAIRYFLATRPDRVDGPVRVPGSPERERHQHLLSDGVPMASATWTAIADLARAAGIAEKQIASVAKRDR
jgi:uncharacterized oxidoreductase